MDIITMDMQAQRYLQIAQISFSEIWLMLIPCKPEMGKIYTSLVVKLHSIAKVHHNSIILSIA